MARQALDWLIRPSALTHSPSFKSQAMSAPPPCADARADPAAKKADSNKGGSYGLLRVRRGCQHHSAGEEGNGTSHQRQSTDRRQRDASHALPAEGGAIFADGSRLRGCPWFAAPPRTCTCEDRADEECRCDAHARGWPRDRAVATPSRRCALCPDGGGWRSITAHDHPLLTPSGRFRSLALLAPGWERSPDLRGRGSPMNLFSSRGPSPAGEDHAFLQDRWATTSCSVVWP